MSDDTPHIDELYVWMVAEPDGSEGIAVVHDPSQGRGLDPTAH
jgi:hypothetical protein